MVVAGQDEKNRRRIMDIKFSFKRKKKIRLEFSDDVDGVQSTGKSANHQSSSGEAVKHRSSYHNHHHQNRRGDESRSIISRLFPFWINRSRKHRSRTLNQNPAANGKSLASGNHSSNEDATEENFQNPRRTNPDPDYDKLCSKIAYSRNTSVSSPNLLYVKRASIDSDGEIENAAGRCKSGSFRRSRASLVFPISEIGGVLAGFEGLNASQTSDLNYINKTTASLSYLPLEIHEPENIDEEKTKSIRTFSAPNSTIESFFRTEDGRSPHPARRNPYAHDFLSSDATEVNKEILISDRNFHFATVRDSDGVQDEQQRLRYASSCSFAHEGPCEKSTRNAETDSFETDYVFIGLDSKKSANARNKRLMRFVSCPFMLEVDHTQNQTAAIDIPMRDEPSKPYSSHRRPYSVHESVLSLDFLESQQIGADVDLEKDNDADEDLPPVEILSLPSKELPLAFGEALWDHSGDLKTQLAFKAGETIAIYFMNKKRWWWGTINDRNGWFPSTHVRLRIDQEMSPSLLESGANFSFINTFSLLGMQETLRSKGEVRSRCMHELLTSEKDYVKTLKDVIEGYLLPARRRPELFSQDDVSVIFCNIEKILRLHKSLYCELRRRIRLGDMFHIRVGDLFIQYKEEFNLYSEYCNNHPNACTRLIELQREKRYTLFFESCRLLQQMISLSIDAFLLTPVQKICKYPLQLNELLKHTPDEHADYGHLQMAVHVMKEVASSINERKRKFEDLHSIAEWQLNVESWQGEDILEVSSEKIKTGTVESLFGGKREIVHLGLFDHLLVLCRKDSLRKQRPLVYLTRFNLDDTRVDILGNTAGLKGSNVIRLTDLAQNSTCWFNSRNREELEEWYSAFRKERKIAETQTQNGSTIPASFRQAAMEAARSKKKIELAKQHRRRKSLTDPFQDFGANVIRRSLRLRRTQSLRDKKFPKPN